MQWRHGKGRGMEERLDNGRGAELCSRAHGDTLQPSDAPRICGGSEQTARPVGSVREESGNHSKVLNIVQNSVYHEMDDSIYLSFSALSFSLPPSTPHRPYSWIESQKMGAFLSVAKGSEEKPWLLEMKYSCGESGKQPIVLVGKGITSNIIIVCS